MRLSSESVCVFLFRRHQGTVEFLMLRRAPARGAFWQSVSGRIEDGETAERAARREAAEETGLEPLRVIVLEKVNVFYNQALEAIQFEPCFGIEVAAEPQKLSLSPEHDECRWSNYHEAQRLIPFQGVRDALRELWEKLRGAEV